ncbi:MAG: hypothetical protein C4313_05775 [Thermoflexus sp.]
MGQRRLLGMAAAIALALAACLSRPAAGPLAYEGPYRVDLAVSQTLPGTAVRYLGVTPRGARVRLGDQEVIRLAGDSLEADVRPHPTLFIRYRLRVYAYDEQALHALGTVRVEMAEAQPRAAPLPAAAALRFTAPVTHRVPRGGVIPGTPIVYEGKVEGRARLGGLPGYPDRNVGDSIVWEGQVHPRVFLKSTFRVLLIEAGWLTVVGTVEILVPSL